MKLILNRFYTKNGDGETLGYFTTEDKEKLNFEPICYTIERPLFYKGNDNVSDNKKTEINESCCINEGEYAVKKTFSPKFRTNLYLVLNVPNRDGIRIHQANNMYQLQGCIAPVEWIINNKSSLLGLNSLESLNKLYSFINDDNFTLLIKSEPKLVYKQLLNKNKKLIIC